MGEHDQLRLGMVLGLQRLWHLSRDGNPGPSLKIAERAPFVQREERMVSGCFHLAVRGQLDLEYLFNFARERMRHGLRHEAQALVKGSDGNVTRTGGQ